MRFLSSSSSLVSKLLAGVPLGILGDLVDSGSVWPVSFGEGDVTSGPIEMVTLGWVVLIDIFTAVGILGVWLDVVISFVYNVVVAGSSGVEVFFGTEVKGDDDIDTLVEMRDEFDDVIVTFCVELLLVNISVIIVGDAIN